MCPLCVDGRPTRLPLPAGDNNARFGRRVRVARLVENCHRGHVCTETFGLCPCELDRTKAREKFMRDLDEANRL